MTLFEPNPIALSLVGLGADRSPRGWIEWAADEGFRAVALDASTPGMRARELDRSARRELAAILRRRELGLVGLDLWIPLRHFETPEKVDRAVSAACGAIELAGELATLVGSAPLTVSMLFTPGVKGETIEPMLESAARHGVRIADHAWPARADDSAGGEALGVGLDAASLLLAGADAADEMLRLGDRLLCARLSDADAAGRTAIGDGELDLDAFRAAATAALGGTPIVLDVRGLVDGAGSARRGLERWRRGV